MCPEPVFHVHAVPLLALSGPYGTRFHIPGAISDAMKAMAGAGMLLTATQWQRAMMVYAFTSDARQGRTGTSTGWSCEGLAALGITGLKSDRTVRTYRNAWKWAMERGAPDIASGDDVELPDLDWDEAFAAVTAHGRLSGAPGITADADAHGADHDVALEVTTALVERPLADQHTRSVLEGSLREQRPVEHGTDDLDADEEPDEEEEEIEQVLAIDDDVVKEVLPSVVRVVKEPDHLAILERVAADLARYVTAVQEGRHEPGADDRRALAVIQRIASKVSTKDGVPPTLIDEIEQFLKSARTRAKLAAARPVPLAAAAAAAADELGS